MMKYLLSIAVLSLLAGPAFADGKYGAIYYSFESDKFGRSWDASSQARAEELAARFCAEAGGKSCERAVWTTAGCGAVARTTSTRGIADMGASWGQKTADAATSRALAECKSRNSGTCRVVAVTCSAGKP